MELLFISLVCLAVGISADLNLSGELNPNLRSLSSSEIPSLEMSNSNNVNSNQAFYTVEVSLGSPSVSLTLLVDTGSNITWVASTSCSNCYTNKTKYNPSNSKSATLLYPYSVVSYEDGSSVSGPAYTDTFIIAGLKANAIFISVNQTSVHWTNFKADGVLGLGYQATGRGPLPIINSLKASGQIPNALFSLYYSDTQFKGRLKPVITFGASDESKYGNKSLSTYKVTVKNERVGLGLWQFTSSGVLMGQNITVSDEISVVLDSAQEAIFVGFEDYYLVSQVLISNGFVKSGSFYQKNCKTSRGFPSINIGYNNSKYLVIPSYRYLALDDSGSTRTCTAYIFQSSDPIWYIGDSLFRSYYSIFDVDNSEITFTPASWLPSIKHKSDDDDDDDSLAGWAIALIVISCVLGAAAIVGIIWYIKRRRAVSYSTDSVGKRLQEVSLHG